MLSVAQTAIVGDVAESDLCGAVLDGRYKVIEPIADGAMGSVYRGERVKLGRAVAIKIMHQELPDELASRQRFEREAKLMALLEHPNCVSVIDFGLHEEKPFLVMDLVRGTSLLELLEQTAKLDIPRASDIIRQVLSGLAHAHELGIVHRDIKPANIMISEKAGHGRQVRILDFGLARLLETDTKLTTGIVVGTPNYMAPEQCKGSDVDARTDLYACGVLLFEMLTGRKPFVADDPIQVVRKHLLEKPPTLASATDGADFGELEQVIAKALAKAAGDRYGSAVEMAKAVEDATTKLVKVSTAALYARAVPETARPATNQLATQSGWNMPSSEGPAAMPARDAPEPARVSTPVAGVQARLPTPPAGVPAEPAPAQASEPVRDLGHEATSLALPSSSAAPQAPLVVPPTRPSTQARATRPELPFTKKQMLIAGGGVLALVVLIALVAGGGGKKQAPKPEPGSAAAVVKEAPNDDPLPKVIERGKAMIESQQYEEAANMLKAARKSHPDSAELAFLAGKAYFGELWWSDGVDNFRDAIELDESYRTNPDLLKTVLKGFLTTPDIDDRIREFMRRDLGTSMRPYLEETAEKHPKKQMRARARSELNARPD